MSSIFTGLTSDQVTALTTAQIAALTTADMVGLTTAQVPYLTTTDLALISTANIAAMTTADVAQLTSSQVASLTTAIAAFTTAEVAAISTVGVGALTTADDGSLTTADIIALTTAQIAALSLPNIAALTTAQLSAFTTTQIAAFSPFQLGGLGVAPTYKYSTQKAFNVDRLVLPTNKFPSAILTGTTWESGVMPINSMTVDKVYGLRAIVAALTSTHVVTVTVQRYLDSAGLTPVGAPGTLTATANVAGYALVNDNVPALYFDVQVANASGSLAVITNPGIAVSANA